MMIPYQIMPQGYDITWKGLYDFYYTLACNL